MAVTRRELPAGYVQSEYIESSGTQHIDTRFMPNQDTRVVVDAQFTNSKTSTFLFGTRTSSNTLTYNILISSQNVLRSDYGNSNAAFASMPFTDRYIFDKNKSVCAIGDASVTNTESTFQTTLPLFLFACNQGGSVKYNGYARIYSCLIYDNGILVRDYIPCRNPQGEYGLYDAVGGVFYGNAGTGEFIAGQLYYDLPDGYTQVEYIESSGTQYIDTGVAVKSTLRIVAGVTPLELVGYSIIGYYTSATESFRLFNYQGEAYLDFGNSSNARIHGGSFPANEHSRIAIGNFYIENVETGETIVSGSAVPAFTQNSNIYINGNQQFAATRWDECLIYDNGVLIRDYAPCISPNNAAGLYDMTGNEFYGNAGTGEFTAGPVVPRPEPEEPEEPEEPVTPEEPLEPSDSPADWITPKTDWAAQDWFNIEDYRRITGNIRFLHAYAQTLWPAFELGGTVAVELGQIPTPNLHNRVEDDIQRLADNTFRLADFEDGKLFIINRPAWDWEDLNRIESNLLKLYYMLTGQDRNRRRLAFELGGVQFG